MKIESDPNIPFNKVNKFDAPRTDVKSVLCFYNGKFPNIAMPVKDVTLPHRLFPNAKLYIRCNITDENTRIYMNEIFQGMCDIELLPNSSASTFSKIDADVLFLHQRVWLFFGGVIEKGAIANETILEMWKKDAYVFYNDESLGTYESLYNIMQLRKNSGKFQQSNQQAYLTVKDKIDWSNVHLLCNENKISDWMNERVSNTLKERNIQIDYLSDEMLYDLKRPSIVVTNRQVDGAFIGSFHRNREKAFNKIFDGSGNLKLDVYGNGSDKLNHYTGDGNYFDNKKAAIVYSNCKWSFYMGKGTPSLYLGATFYEPLLNGCPVFIWNGTDPDHKLFPHLDVYFNTETELAKLLSDASDEDLRQLWINELNKIFKD